MVRTRKAALAEPRAHIQIEREGIAGIIVIILLRYVVEREKTKTPSLPELRVEINIVIKKTRQRRRRRPSLCVQSQSTFYLIK